jgi:uncharacterized Zn finger protein (UPF0148 family)
MRVYEVEAQCPECGAKLHSIDFRNARKCFCPFCGKIGEDKNPQLVELIITKKEVITLSSEDYIKLLNWKGRGILKAFSEVVKK